MDSSGLTIREADEKDLPSILALYGAAGLNARGTLALDEARRIFARMRSYPDYRVYVAHSDGEPVGTFALLVMENLANAGVPSAIVEDVAVRPDQQRRGVGRAMMACAIDRARERGCYKLALSSNAKREDAHRFYESLGFARHGVSFLVEPR